MLKQSQQPSTAQEPRITGPLLRALGALMLTPDNAAMWENVAGTRERASQASVIRAEGRRGPALLMGTTDLPTGLCREGRTGQHQNGWLAVLRGILCFQRMARESERK